MCLVAKRSSPATAVMPYNPYSDGSAIGVTAFDKTLVKAFVENAETGAGATLDYDLLATRGNDHFGEETAIKGITSNNDAQVVDINYYGVNGSRYATPQKGLNIMVFQMSDGTTRTQKIYK